MQVTALTDEQEALRAVAREVLESEAGPTKVRDLSEAHGPFDPGLWSMGGELGWHGMEVPESLGGSGQTFLEVSLVLRELGRAATAGPFLSQSLAIAGLVEAVDDPIAGSWLERLAAGDAIGAVVIGTMDLAGNTRLTMSAERVGKGMALTGEQADVLDVGLADMALVAAGGEAGPAVFLVTEPAAALDAEWQRTHDRTRRLYDIRANGVEIPPHHTLATGDQANALINSLWDRAATGIAVDAAGGAARVLEMTVDYTSQRKQFGRAIATFQAVKHTCADMFVESEVARIASDAAVLEIVDTGPRQRFWSSVAKFRAVDAYAKAAGDALQMHGGIGMTWEFDLHYWLKRAKMGQALFGHSDAHRARVCRLAAETRVNRVSATDATAEPPTSTR